MSDKAVWARRCQVTHSRWSRDSRFCYTFYIGVMAVVRTYLHGSTKRSDCCLWPVNNLPSHAQRTSCKWKAYLMRCDVSVIETWVLDFITKQDCVQDYSSTCHGAARYGHAANVVFVLALVDSSCWNRYKGHLNIGPTPEGCRQTALWFPPNHWANWTVFCWRQPMRPSKKLLAPCSIFTSVDRDVQYCPFQRWLRNMMLLDKITEIFSFGPKLADCFQSHLILSGIFLILWSWSTA